MDGTTTLTRQDTPPEAPLGLIPGLDQDIYHASPGVSQSSLKVFAAPGGPARYRAGVRRETAALKFGGVLHTAVLEPHMLERRYSVTELERTGTNAWAEAERRAAGRILVKRTEWDQAQRMRDAVQRHAGARQLLTPELEIETSLFWIDPETGMLCRGRPDGLRRDWRLMLDVKSCIDASERGFSYSVAEWGYDWQQYHYECGYGQAAHDTIDNFVFLAIEKEAPHLVGMYDLDKRDVAEAGSDVRQAMRDLRHCQETDTWPGYSPELVSLTVPKTHRRKFAN